MPRRCFGDDLAASSLGQAPLKRLPERDGDRPTSERAPAPTATELLVATHCRTYGAIVDPFVEAHGVIIERRAPALSPALRRSMADASVVAVHGSGRTQRVRNRRSRRGRRSKPIGAATRSVPWLQPLPRAICLGDEDERWGRHQATCPASRRPRRRRDRTACRGRRRGIPEPSGD
jgi:hypothetical protein